MQRQKPWSYSCSFPTISLQKCKQSPILFLCFTSTKSYTSFALNTKDACYRGVFWCPIKFFFKGLTVTNRPVLQIRHTPHCGAGSATLDSLEALIGADHLETIRGQSLQMAHSRYILLILLEISPTFCNLHLVKDLSMFCVMTQTKVWISLTHAKGHLTGLKVRTPECQITERLQIQPHDMDNSAHQVSAHWSQPHRSTFETLIFCSTYNALWR